MRRQFGADHVEINTVEQWAKAYLHEPVRIDFSKFVAAAATASFPTTVIQLEIEGTVQENATGLRLEVTGTDQSFPIEAGILAPGQLYVGLSRAPSLAGLSLATPVTEAHVLHDRRVRQYQAKLFGRPETAPDETPVPA